MNKSQRIIINPLNKEASRHLFVKLDQDVKTLEFLSMKLKTEDVYAKPNSDYGILVGRVIGNDGVGIPNAKLSIFIPLSNEDEENPDIKSVYPFKNPSDVNNEGKRYNLLDRVATQREDGSYSPKQPFGSFPIKPEIVTNKVLNDVYKKYYKYTTVTNDSGDYMIFGAPVGTHTVHLSVDITDIGKYSMNPASMVINLGYSPNLFTKNNTLIKPSSDFTDLPHIETQEISVDIIPFWGDSDNFEIGITRQNFRIKAVLVNTFTIFGTSFTDEYNSTWGGNTSAEKLNRLYRHNDPVTNVSFDSKRIGTVKEMIFYYPPEVTDDYIENTIENTEYYNIKDVMSLLDKSLYTSHKRDGDFVFIVSCNRKKVITGEDGAEIEVPHTYPSGVFTEFRGFMTLEYDDDDIGIADTIELDGRNYHPVRYRFKFPQHGEFGEFYSNIKWKKSTFKFEANKIYSISRFNSTTYNNSKSGEYDNSSRTLTTDRTNTLNNTSTSYSNVGCLIGENQYINNQDELFPSNKYYNNFHYFGANWLNFCVYFPQIKRLAGTNSSYSDVHSNTNIKFSVNKYILIDNDYDIAAGHTNTKWFARYDIHWTDFIEVPVSDIVNFYDEVPKKGFKSSELNGYGVSIDKSYYRYGQGTPSWGGDACPYNGGRIAGNPSLSTDSNVYFYKGLNDADCIAYLVELGIVSA